MWCGAGIADGRCLLKRMGLCDDQKYLREEGGRYECQRPAFFNTMRRGKQ